MVAVDNARWLKILLIFTIFDFTRLSTIVRPLGLLQVQGMIGAALFYYWLKHGDRNDIKRMPFAPLFVFLFFSATSIFWANNNFWAFQATRDLIYALAFFALPASTLLVDREAMRSFSRVFCLCGAFCAVWALTHSGFGPGGFIGDENDTGLFLNVTAGFAVLCARDPAIGKPGRILFVAVTILIIAGVIATDSRGAFVGLLVLFVAMWWTSRNRLKMAAIVGGFVLLLPLIVYPLLPPGYLEDMQTSLDPNDSTRRERQYFWDLAWDMYLDNPVLGVGAENFPWTVGDYELMLPEEERAPRASGGRAVHSMYMQLFSEHGTVGTICVLGVVLFTLFKLNRLRALARRKPTPGLEYDMRAGAAVFASMVTLLASGAFISVLYFPTMYYLIAVAHALFKRVRLETGEAPVASMAGGVRRAGVRGRVTRNGPAPKHAP